MRGLDTPPPAEWAPALDEPGVEEAVARALVETFPELRGDPGVEVEARSRDGYFAAFVFVADAGWLRRIEAARFEIGERANRYRANALIYPRAWAR